ncbi:MAG TPA: type II toxin-antitoxin system RelB/DinJ family antitoxin [Roseiarcus sp.]|nr:type II toxin-antitoxin system RelB/DinJ family antitoxin [Roseiarcus sp.]
MSDTAKPAARPFVDRSARPGGRLATTSDDRDVILGSEEQARLLRARRFSELDIVLKSVGLSVSDAFGMLLVRVAAEKWLPFDPLTPFRASWPGIARRETGVLARIARRETGVLARTWPVERRASFRTPYDPVLHETRDRQSIGS